MSDNNEQRTKGLYLTFSHTIENLLGVTFLRAALGAIWHVIRGTEKQQPQNISEQALQKKLNVSTPIKELLKITYAVFHACKDRVDGHVALPEGMIKQRLAQTLFDEQSAFKVRADSHDIPNAERSGLTAIIVEKRSPTERYVIVGGLEADKPRLAWRDINALCFDGLFQQSLQLTKFCRHHEKVLQDGFILIGQSMGTIVAWITAVVLNVDKVVCIEARALSDNLLHHILSVSRRIVNILGDKNTIIDESRVLAVVTRTLILNTPCHNWWNSWGDRLSVGRIPYTSFSQAQGRQDYTLCNTTLFGAHRASKSLNVAEEKPITYKAHKQVIVTPATAIYMNAMAEEILVYLTLGLLLLAINGTLLNRTLLVILKDETQAIIATITTLVVLLGISYSLASHKPFQESVKGDEKCSLLGRSDEQFERKRIRYGL